MFQSVSDLSELRILQLANNRLLEYPQDLKNGFAMTHLEELNLNGNDIREVSVKINILIVNPMNRQNRKE